MTDTETTRRPGDWVGPYALVRPLGVGGSGEVWEAVLHGPAGFRKPVALKLLLGAREADRHEQQRLIREAGREPVERDTLYHRVERSGSQWHSAEPVGSGLSTAS